MDRPDRERLDPLETIRNPLIDRAKVRPSHCDRQDRREEPGSWETRFLIALGARIALRWFEAGMGLSVASKRVSLCCRGIGVGIKTIEIRGVTCTSRLDLPELPSRKKVVRIVCFILKFLRFWFYLISRRIINNGRGFVVRWPVSCHIPRGVVSPGRGLLFMPARLVALDEGSDIRARSCHGSCGGPSSPVRCAAGFAPRLAAPLLYDAGSR